MGKGEARQGNVFPRFDWSAVSGFPVFKFFDNHTNVHS